MDVALLRTHQPGYLWASWRTLRQDISDFLEIASDDEELLFCASVSVELQWDQAETEFRAIVHAELEALRQMLSHVRPISPSLGSKAWLGWLWLWRGVYAAWATHQSKLMPWLDRPDEDGQPLPMPVSKSVLRWTVMAFLTTAKALPPMLVRTPLGEKRGAAGSAGAPADAPKADAAAARLTGRGDTEALQSEMDAALDLCRSLPEEHLPKAAANMGPQLSVLASAAGLVPMIVKAKTGAHLAAMLSAHPLLFGAKAMKAAAQMAKWRDYVKAKILAAVAAPGCVRLLEDLKALFARLPKDTNWGLHAVSLAVRLSASVGAHHAMLEAANKKHFFRSAVSAMVESTAPEAHTAHIKAVLELVLGSTSSLPYAWPGAPGP